MGTHLINGSIMEVKMKELSIKEQITTNDSVSTVRHITQTVSTKSRNLSGIAGRPRMAQTPMDELMSSVSGIVVPTIVFEF